MASPINFNQKKKETTIPQKVKHFLFPEKDEELFKEVEEYNNFANYALEGSSSSRSILNGLKDVPSMMDDPICSSAVKCVMQTAFQTNSENKLFKLVTPSTLIENELNQFHQDIDADNFLLTDGYNCLLWGQLPWKHIYNKEGVLERVLPIPDFTSVTPVIISGKTIGFIDEENNFVPSYMYTYSQLEYYKDLGGNSNSRFMTVGGTTGTDAEMFQNEFSYANSYLGSASKPWRNVNIIEDALLLARMDQSNYYRIISVNVGGQVYSKSAIQVLNYYRNLFKKVRRVNYDSNGMSSRGNGQEFEVIVPKTQNQGVEIQNVGGEIDVKALKDLDTQYQKLFAALQLQPSMIGFSEDTPSSLGDSAALTWDKRFAKVCKTVSYSAYDALRNIDYLHLRSLGYDVDPDDWNYATVSQTLQDDADKGETLKLAIENLNQITDAFGKMEAQYDKDYLVKSILGESLGNYGIDCEKLLTKPEDVGAENKDLIATSLKKEMAKRAKNFQKDILTKDAHIMSMAGMFSESTATEIVSAFTKSEYDKLNIQEKVTPISLKEVYSSFAVKRDNPIDLTNFVIYEEVSCEAMNEWFKNSKKKEGEAMDFKFPLHCPKEIEITAGDLDLSGPSYIDNLYVDEFGQQFVTSKADLCKYLYNYMNGGLDNYCANVIIRK